jgi:NAD(P)-dependent dehydrogenase (short-subunit alcohol dehydrogenase family)
MTEGQGGSGWDSAPLDGKVAVVTGSGAGGIGAASALRLAGAGANVVLNDRLEGTTADTERAIRDLGRDAVGVVANVLRPEGAGAVVDAALERWGRIDILVNVVGGMKFGDIRIWDLPEDAWDFTIALNLKSTFLCTKAVLPHMMDRRDGRIINFSSTAAVGSPEHAHYATAKAGIVAFTRSCAAQLAPYNVTVNAISPGPTLTESVLNAGFLRADSNWADQVPLGRPNQPDDIAQSVLFLASDAGRNITGVNLAVAGGLPFLG